MRPPFPSSSASSFMSTLTLGLCIRFSSYILPSAGVLAYLFLLFLLRFSYIQLYVYIQSQFYIIYCTYILDAVLCVMHDVAFLFIFHFLLYIGQQSFHQVKCIYVYIIHIVQIFIYLQRWSDFFFSFLKNREKFFCFHFLKLCYSQSWKYGALASPDGVNHPSAQIDYYEGIGVLFPFMIIHPLSNGRTTTTTTKIK